MKLKSLVVRTIELILR